MPSTRLNIQSGNRAQRIRRQINANRNAAALARLQAAEARDRQLAVLQELTMEPDFNVLDEQQEFQFNQTENSQQHDNIAGEEENHEWVSLVEDQPDEIDRTIASEKEQHRQQAREFNWKALLVKLHPVYMRLKAVTQNWAGSNSHHSFVECSSTCRKKNNRNVDLVDVYGKS